MRNMAMFVRDLLTIGKLLGSTCCNKNLPGTLYGGRIGSSLFSRFIAISSTTVDVPKLKKAPRGPYMIFSNAKMAEVRQTNPGLRVPELGRMVGQMWRNLPEQDKEGYKAQHIKEKEEFKRVMDSLTEEQRQQLTEEKKEKRKKRNLKKIKSMKEEMGCPKPVGINPYILYLKSKMLERGDAPLKMYVHGLSDFWKKMPEEDKQQFIDAARKNSGIYREKKEEWDKEMISLGYDKLLKGHKASVKEKKTKVSVKVKKPKTKKLTEKKQLTKGTSPETKTVGTQTPVSLHTNTKELKSKPKISGGSDNTRNK